MAKVQLERVTKRFPDGNLAVDGVCLEIEDREFLVLVGPSGCGKSTTLRMIAGLEGASSGDVVIGGRVVTDVAPKDRDIAMVFQNYALYPHMSVYKNLSFGLTLRYGGGVIARGLRKIFQPRYAAELALLRSGIDSQVRQTALRLGIEHLLDRKPHQLSGGERQRVALGRAIVRNPAAFLFDEPLSNLDAKLRQQMRIELKRLHRDLRATMIYVTHDQVEAMTLGDRVAVMNEGKILQVGRPLDIYQRPANLFVARFIGSVPINLCQGTVRQRGDEVQFEGEGGFQGRWLAKLLADDVLGRLFPDGEFPDGEFRNGNASREIVVGFRAEDIRIAKEEGGFGVVVTDVDRLGESTLVHGQVHQDNTEKILNEKPSTILVRIESGARVELGDRMNLTVGSKHLLWFDPETGENLLRE